MSFKFQVFRQLCNWERTHDFLTLRLGSFKISPVSLFHCRSCCCFRCCFLIVFVAFVVIIVVFVAFVVIIVVVFVVVSCRCCYCHNCRCCHWCHGGNVAAITSNIIVAVGGVIVVLSVLLTFLLFSLLLSLMLFLLLLVSSLLSLLLVLLSDLPCLISWPSSSCCPISCYTSTFNVPKTCISI